MTTAKGSDASQSSLEDQAMDDMENYTALEARIKELEDKLAILQVVAGYGPSVDGGAAREAGLDQVINIAPSSQCAKE